MCCKLAALFSSCLSLQELLYWQGLFNDFYSKHYSTYRQLIWQHSMSTAMLRANFPKGAKELSVSLMQVRGGRRGVLGQPDPLLFCGMVLCVHAGTRAAACKDACLSPKPNNPAIAVLCCAQALVLLLYNDVDELSYESIKEQLGVEDDKELQRTLLSLSVGKVIYY